MIAASTDDVPLVATTTVENSKEKPARYLALPGKAVN